MFFLFLLNVKQMIIKRLLGLGYNLSKKKIS